jgi:hypothetical protein
MATGDCSVRVTQHGPCVLVEPLTLGAALWLRERPEWPAELSALDGLLCFEGPALAALLLDLAGAGLLPGDGGRPC